MSKRKLFIRITAFFIIIAVLVLSTALFFRVNDVSVEGNERHTSDQIEAIANISQGRQLFTVPSGRIRQQLLDEFPYIKNVTITLRLPSTVRIIIEERHPVGFLEYDGYYWIIDPYGRLLEQTTTRPAGFDIRGLTLYNPTINTYFQVVDGQYIYRQTYEFLIRELVAFYDDLNYVDMSNIANIAFRIHDRYRVELGVISDLTYKLHFLNEALEYLEAGPPRRGTILLANSPETRRANFLEDGFE